MTTQPQTDSNDTPEQNAPQQATAPTQAEEELQKDLDRREELCRQAEQVAEERDWRHGSGDLRRLQEQWNDIRRWHDPREDALWGRFKTAREAYYQARDAAHEQARAAKEKLVAEAERLAKSDQWNATAERMRTLMDDWKAAGRTGDREEDDRLWERFNAARRGFFDRRSEHFTQLDERRAKAKETKERLVHEATLAAATSADWTGDQWAKASARMRELMDQWKAAGVAPKADNDRLWEEFQAARKPFFDAQHAHYETLDAARKTAAEAKQRLIDQARQLAQGNDFGREATERAKQLDRDWKSTGFAGKELGDRLWKEFTTAKEEFWDKRRAHNDQRHEEWLQRTRDAIDRRKQRIANLQEQIDRLQDRLNHAYATDHVEEMQERLDDRKEALAQVEAEVRDMESQLKD